jgi:hypothetical protein
LYWQEIYRLNFSTATSSTTILTSMGSFWYGRTTNNCNTSPTFLSHTISKNWNKQGRKKVVNKIIHLYSSANRQIQNKSLENDIGKHININRIHLQETVNSFSITPNYDIVQMQSSRVSRRTMNYLHTHGSYQDALNQTPQ